MQEEKSQRKSKILVELQMWLFIMSEQSQGSLILGKSQNIHEGK